MVPLSTTLPDWRGLATTGRKLLSYGYHRLRVVDSPTFKTREYFAGFPETVF